MTEEDLATSASLLESLAADYPDLAGRAARVAERIRHGRFHVAVVGEFKRGKSTFVNALIGRALLPTGVVPVTSVATEVSFGTEGAEVVHVDGTRRNISLDVLADFVTESANPNNKAQVNRVEVRVPEALLATGLTVVDTPGVGSVHEHNTGTAIEAHRGADAAIVVLAADAALSHAEREIMVGLSGRQARVFVVLNKADHLDASGLVEVRRFLSTVLPDPTVRVWALSARIALAARLEGRRPGPDAGEFSEFLDALESFVHRDLGAARQRAARLELDWLKARLIETVSTERAVLDMDEQTMIERVSAFGRAADLERRAFDNDRVVLAHEVSALASTVAERCDSFARDAFTRRAGDLHLPTRSTSALEARRVLQEQVEGIVTEEFDTFRASETARIEQTWKDLAGRFRAATAERVATVRGIAADLFSFEAPPVEIPSVDETADGPFYLFSHTGTFSDSVVEPLQRLVPVRLARWRLLPGGRRRLARELDKHAGRLRSHLSERLDSARGSFEDLMRAELAAATSAIASAAASAERHRAETGASRAIRRTRHQAVLTGLGVGASEESVLDDAVHLWLERCRALAESPLDGIENAADELAGLSKGNRQVMERARRLLLAEKVDRPTDRVTAQMLALWRRSFENGTWDWEGDGTAAEPPETGALPGQG